MSELGDSITRAIAKRQQDVAKDNTPSPQKDNDQKTSMLEKAKAVLGYGVKKSG